MTVTEAVIEELVVRSRHLVKTFGEVFRPRHMVDRMLDPVREDLETSRATAVSRCVEQKAETHAWR